MNTLYIMRYIDITCSGFHYADKQLGPGWVHVKTGVHLHAPPSQTGRHHLQLQLRQKPLHILGPLVPLPGTPTYPSSKFVSLQFTKADLFLLSAHLFCREIHTVWGVKAYWGVWLAGALSLSSELVNSSNSALFANLLFGIIHNP